MNADNRERLGFWMVMVTVALLLALLALSGCAALPMFMQPSTDLSNKAEGAFLVLDTMDTLQTVQIAKHPQCYYEDSPVAARIYGSEHPSVGRVVLSNLLLMTAHTMVASWLDDEVAQHGAGPWYDARIAFHTISILGSGTAVIHNHHEGLGWGITSASCPPAPVIHKTVQH